MIPCQPLFSGVVIFPVTYEKGNSVRPLIWENVILEDDCGHFVCCVPRSDNFVRKSGKPDYKCGLRKSIVTSFLSKLYKKKTLPS